MVKLPQQEVSFHFQYQIPKSKTVDVWIELSLPLKGTCEDHVQQYVKEFRIPCFAEDAFSAELTLFVRDKVDEVLQREGDDAVERLAQNIDQLTGGWEKDARDLLQCKTTVNSAEEEFGRLCHSLLHSPALPAVRAEEIKASKELRALVKQRNDELKSIQDHHLMIMEGYVNNGTPDTAAVNDLAVNQAQQRENCEARWASELSHLMSSQRRHFYSWIMKLYEETNGGEHFDVTHTTPPGMTEILELPPSLLEESFTINIGSQLKITHNMRVFVDDVWNLLSGSHSSPERLQTALSLYSTALSGLILLVDNRLNLFSGNTNTLAKICEVTPEFHFLPLEEQLSAVRQKLLAPAPLRRRTPTNYLIDDTIPSTLIKEDKNSGDLILPDGTCYLTKHSNLKQIHTIFHLVSKPKGTKADMSSRDLVLLGLRTALRIAAHNGVDIITIPLLLTHTLASDVELSWCLKRAELVFKCVKGFMIENASLGTASKTVHFLLPKSTPHNVFQTICNMFPTIFRVPCPLMLDNSSRKKTLSVAELLKSRPDIL